LLFHEFKKLNVCLRGTEKVLLIIFWLSLVVQSTEFYFHNNADKRNSEIKFRVNWFVTLKLQMQEIISILIP